MKKSSKLPLLSLVLPIFNEEDSLPSLILELQKLKQKIGSRYQLECIFVDDGSQDSTKLLLDSYQSLLPHTCLVFSRNFGHQAALLAGLRAAAGEVIISLDSDLQHPPSFIPQLLAEYEAGFDVVFTQRTNDVSLSWFKRTSSLWFYRVINAFSETHIQPAGSDFRLVSRPVLDALLSLPETRIFLRGMVSWVGFKSTTLNFSSNPRTAGQSKYNLYKMIKLALFGIVSFSTAPLYLSVLMGFIFSLATLLYGVYVLYVRFWTGGVVAGWSSVIFVLLGIGSILSFLLAIIGAYLAAVYDEVKQRPPFIVKPPQKTP